MENLILLWQDAGGAAGQEANPLITLVFLMVGLGIFYFFMIRPQVKQQQEQKTFSSKLKKGAKVITVGGLHGTVAEIDETHVTLLIAPKTPVVIQKDSISLELTKAIYGEK